MARRKERPFGPLDPRSQQILRAVIEEYVTTAEPVGSQTLVEHYPAGRQLGHRAQRDGRARGSRLSDPPAHQRRPRADRCRLPAVRRVDRAAAQPGAGRAIDDPPPVRPGRVRQRAVVPAGGGDDRRGDARGRTCHARQAAHLPVAPHRPGRHRERRPPASSLSLPRARSSRSSFRCPSRTTSTSSTTSPGCSMPSWTVARAAS